MPPIATSSTRFLSSSKESPLEESPSLKSLISALSLQPHPEGGYYAETDRSPFRIPNPFLHSPLVSSFLLPSSPSSLSSNQAHLQSTLQKTIQEGEIDEDNLTRAASTTIFYLLAPSSPSGVFHRNKARTMHTLHRGRGQYVIIHPPSPSVSLNGAAVGPGHGTDLSPTTQRKARIETFIVGPDVSAGEKLQWMVEGDVWKASFLLPPPTSSISSSIQSSPMHGQAVAHDPPADQVQEENVLLISETVVPGFDFRDHDFLTWEGFAELVDDERREEWGWLVKGRPSLGGLGEA